MVTVPFIGTTVPLLLTNRWGDGGSPTRTVKWTSCSHIGHGAGDKGCFTSVFPQIDPEREYWTGCIDFIT